MNLHKQALEALDLTPYSQVWCCVCGKPKEHAHHIAYRSHGGKKTISLCSDCHQKEHNHTIRFEAVNGELKLNERKWGEDYWTTYSLKDRNKAFEKSYNTGGEVFGVGKERKNG